MTDVIARKQPMVLQVIFEMKLIYCTLSKVIVNVEHDDVEVFVNYEQN